MKLDYPSFNSYCKFNTIWEYHHPAANPEHLGFIPSWLNPDDPRPVREQLDRFYRHGGGWHHFPGFKLLPNKNIRYYGDPDTQLLASTKVRDEEVRLYEHSWVMILQPDGSFEINRMD